MPLTSFADFAQRADHSLLNTLRPDPQATADGRDHRPRPVFSGHYVPVTPTPLPAPMRPYGWTDGYALSIYGSESIQQCPFGTGSGYGDGRAISVFEGLFEGRRWELQLKGSGTTPDCRGADGRAVLRSSVREFLAQEFMHALGVPTTRSLMVLVSRAETVRRPRAAAVSGQPPRGSTSAGWSAGWLHGAGCSRRHPA